jgi:hypothetical protein
MRRVFGFVIGAVPSSGAEMRALINERTQSFAADVKQAANTKRIELTDRLDTLRAPKS